MMISLYQYAKKRMSFFFVYARFEIRSLISQEENLLVTLSRIHYDKLLLITKFKLGMSI